MRGVAAQTTAMVVNGVSAQESQCVVKEGQLRVPVLASASADCSEMTWVKSLRLRPARSTYPERFPVRPLSDTPCYPWNGTNATAIQG